MHDDDKTNDDLRLRRNPAVTLVLAFFQVFLVIMPVAVPFFQSKGLSMQEVFSLQALFALVVLLAEVPSGYVADLFGRKRTLVVGAAFCGLGHTLLLGADGFWTLALFEISLGIGSSLISGADIALLYDTEAALGRGEREQRQVVGRRAGLFEHANPVAVGEHAIDEMRPDEARATGDENTCRFSRESHASSSASRSSPGVARSFVRRLTRA